VVIITLLLIGLFNVFIGALCISVSESGLLGVIYAPFVMLFGVLFIPFSWIIVFLMYAIRLNFIKNQRAFVMFGAAVGLLISIPFFTPAFNENTDINFSIGFGIGWIISGLFCNYFVNKVAMSNQSLKGSA
jgi:hypothetical protein